MKKRIILSLITASIMASLCGCGNIKFIEKAQPKQEQNLGGIEGDDITEEDGSENVIQLKDSKSDASEVISKTSESSTTSKQNVTKEVDESTMQVGGITFDISGASGSVMYALADSNVYTQPSEVSKVYQEIKKGDIVSIVGTSESWTMVRIERGPAVYMLNSDLSYDYVPVDTKPSLNLTPSTQTSEVPSTSEQGEPSTQTSDSTSTSTSASTSETTSTSQQPSEDTQASTQPSTSQEPVQTEEPVYEEPEDDYQGIDYPSNPNSESYNLGVKFADVNFGMNIRHDGVEVSNGPDRIANSTGYYSLGTFNKGDYVVVTGIGDNGYLRIEYNGGIGFIPKNEAE